MRFNYVKNLFYIAIIFLSGCTPYKQVPYFQNLDQGISSEKITNSQETEVQPGDILAIHVSSLNQAADAVFNSSSEYLPNNKLNNISNQDYRVDNSVSGFLVNSEGIINLPYIGKKKVSGLPVRQVTNDLEKALAEYFTNPILNVRITNFKVSVMGDVKTPGVYNVPNSRINLNEALTLAGDMMITGIRKNVLLIRENNGMREYVHLDMTSKSIFSSPYYYLKNNDVIYVQPNKQAVAKESDKFQKVGLALSVLSIVVYLITRKNP